MKLREDGFVMQMAYPEVLDRPTGKVNLCPLFWRFMIMTFVARPIMVFIMCPFMNVMGFLTAKFYAVPSWKECDVECKDYRNWPRIKGRRIVPFMVLVGSWVVYLVTLLLLSIKLEIWVIIGASLMVATAFVLVALNFWKNKSARETRSLVGAFISAKVKKVCPVVELVKR